MEKGKFITFEGCEGAGKSTQLSLLRGYLEREGIDCVFTREPGGSRVSEKIRAVILDRANEGMTDECEALLYAASRVQTIHDVLRPALMSGKVVVCDRYVDSSFAYQGYARGLGLDFVEKINAYALENFLPDATIFLDIDPASAFSRKNGADEDDRIEQAGMAFHERVYAGYLALAKKYPDRFFPVDARGTKEQTHAAILRLLKEKHVL